MNQFTTPDTFSASRLAGLRRLSIYLRDHGDSLDRILRQARANSEENESRVLQEFLDGANSEHDGGRLADCLRDLVNELLCTLGEPLFELPGGHMGSDFDAGLCWHASRLTELHRELSVALGT